MNWSIFWGIFLVLLGLSFIIKVVFNVDIPIIKFLIGFFFIYLGIKLFIGKDFSIFSHRNDENVVAFGQKTIRDVNDSKEYNVVFGRGIIDLRSIDLSEQETVKIRINTVFGSSDVLLNDTIPFKIEATTAFAEAKLPDGNSTAFGTINYENFEKNDTSFRYPVLIVESTTVFGNTLFKNRKF